MHCIGVVFIIFLIFLFLTIYLLVQIYIIYCTNKRILLIDREYIVFTVAKHEYIKYLSHFVKCILDFYFY